MKLVEQVSWLMAGFGIAWVYLGVSYHSGFMAAVGVVAFVVGFAYGPLGRRR